MRIISTLFSILMMFQFQVSLFAQSKNLNTGEYICGFGRTQTLKLNQTDSSVISTSYVSPTKVVLRCGYSRIYEEPLYVINGYPVLNMDEIKSLNVNDVESINILKESVAAAIYSCRPARGLILITTKQSKLRKFIIKDFQDGSRLPRATVSFISTDKKDTIMTVANDSGVVVTDRLKGYVSYSMVVSSVGHKIHFSLLSNSYRYKEQEIFLLREVKECSEVILESFAGRTIYCRRIWCGIRGSYIKATPEVITMKAPETPNLKIFPNPVQRGSVFNIHFNNHDRNDKMVRIVSMDRKNMLQQVGKANEGRNVFQIQTDSRWAAGIYFVQIYENGKLLTSEKIIIQ